MSSELGELWLGRYNSKNVITRGHWHWWWGLCTDGDTALGWSTTLDMTTVKLLRVVESLRSGWQLLAGYC